MSRIEKKRQYTPKLRVKYIGLADPHFFTGDEKGQYSITLKGSPEELQDWIEETQRIREDLMQQQIAQEGKKKMPEDDNVIWMDEVDSETDEPTGMTLLKFRHAAHGFNKKTGSKWDIKSVVVDATGHPMDKEMVKKIGRDSIVRCCYDLVSYVFKGKVGVKAELVATQLIKPVWFEANSRADAFVGQVEEGGFSVNEGGEF